MSLLQKCYSKISDCSEKFIAKDAPECDPSALAARLAALKEIVRFVPDAFELKSDVITQFLVKEVLMRSSSEEVSKLVFVLFLVGC